MTDNDMSRFWEQLRKRTMDPQGFTMLTDEEAERRMAEAGDEPMSEEEIDRIVQRATAEGPQGIVHRDIEKPQPRYFIKVAAAVMITLLLVAGVVSTRAILWPERDDHAGGFQSLEYRDAILIALNRHEDQKARNDSLGRIYVSTLAGIRALQQVGEQEEGLRETANRLLHTLRETLAGSTTFREPDLDRVRAFRHAVKESAKFIQDSSNPMSARRQRLADLGDQLRLGILVLKRTKATEKASTLLAATAGVFLRNLGKQLGR